MARRLRTLLDGLKFGEGPRWRDGKLYLSFITTRTLARADMSTFHHYVSFPLPFLLDLVTLPITGLLDGIRILSSD